MWRAIVAGAGLLLLIVIAIVTIRCYTAPNLPLHETVKLTGEQGDPLVSVTRIVKDGARLDWSAKLDLIAFDRKGDDNLYDVWVMQPDGSGERCLTCDTPGLPTKNVGQPSWHPSGDYVVVQAEKQDHPGGSRKAMPGIGVENEVWLVTSDGKQAFQLTAQPDGTGVLHPHFSHDGKRLLWSEMLEAPSGLLGGNWRVNLADFVVDGGEPRLENIERFQPLGKVLHETHGFSPDDTKILFTAQPPDAPDWAFDIYEMELASGELRNLTESDDQWDEHAHYSPSGEKIVWMSSLECDCDPSKLGKLKTDLWMMNADGSGKRRLTHFSDGDFPERAGRKVIVGDNSWNSDGSRLAIFLIHDRNFLNLLNLRRGGETIVVGDFASPQ